jgi:hypothetical protein
MRVEVAWLVLQLKIAYGERITGSL